jgi:hypothetical protein
MKNKIIFLILIFLNFNSCGVKTPPLPPLSPEEELAEETKLKEKEKKREMQKKYIEEKRKNSNKK